MDAALHARLLTRCRGRCECGCGAKVPPGEIDHFFGRAKAEETEATCWVLSVRCHYAKTRNSPDGATWQRKFAEHCRRLGYVESQRRAEARQHFVETRGAFGTALGSRR
jgi:hypothetical protein